MRQKDDPVFAQMLERIRIGNLKLDDIERLKECVLKNDQQIDQIDFAIGQYCNLIEKYQNKNLLCMFPIIYYLLFACFLLMKK